MSKRTLIALAAVLILVTGIVVAVMVLRTERVGDTVQVIRGDIEVTVETVGRVNVIDLESIQAPLTTSVELVAVAPGDEVREGDVLIELDQSPFRALIDQAEQQLFDAEAALSALQADGVGTDPGRVAERIAAQEQVRAAEQAVAAAETALGDSLVLSPIDGTVIAVPVSEGSDIGQNAELIQVAGLQEFELEIDIDEVDLPLIDRGAEARIVLEAYPEHEIVSEIHSIARRAELVAGTTVFPATVQFPGQDGLTILPGMNAEVRITTDVREDILVLPEGALATVGRRTYVDVVVDGDVERREIRTGIRGGGMVEVAEGLVEGDQVVRP